MLKNQNLSWKITLSTIKIFILYGSHPKYMSDPEHCTWFLWSFNKMFNLNMHVYIYVINIIGYQRILQIILKDCINAFYITCNRQFQTVYWNDEKWSHSNYLIGVFGDNQITKNKRWSFLMKQKVVKATKSHN